MLTNVRGINSIERHKGKIVLHATAPAWWRFRQLVKMKMLWLLQAISMTVKYILMFGAAAFFVLWITDIYYMLWPACMIVMVFSVAFFSRIVLYLKKERGTF